MRKIECNDIVKNRYSIKDKEVVEMEDGDFFNKQITNEINKYQQSNDNLSVNRLKELDKKQKNTYAEKICLNRYIEMKSKNDKKIRINSVLNKVYEIYTACLNTEKIMLCDTNYFSDSKDKEVYYDKNIAIEIYNLKTELKENISNSFPELIEMYQEDIITKENRIQELKIEDEKIYQENMMIYKMINKSESWKKFIESYNLMEEENYKLRNKLNKSKNVVNSLSNKLLISMNKYVELNEKILKDRRYKWKNFLVKIKKKIFI